MIAYCKHSLEKFARYLDNIGKDMMLCASQDLSAAADVISPETDIKAFISNNRTGNPIIQREEF